MNKKNKKYYRHPVLAALLVLSVITTLKGSLKNPIEVSKVLNMRFPINSSGDDFSPTLTADGKILLFNSKLKNEESHNIYISHFKNNRWTTPEYFEILNSRYDNDETPFITPDGSLIVFASDRLSRKRGTYSNRMRMTYDIYFSRKVEGKWTEPEPIPGDVNTKNNERSPCLSPDKKTLYFARWPYKNIRKSKIYRAILKKGRYTDIKALPEPVNTGSYELSFTPSHLRPGFYFSSRRKKGFGGWDIYFAYFTDSQFTKVVNLGPEINSPGNDLFITEVGNRLYFSTNRAGGFGKYDIYFADIRKINIPRASEILPDDYYSRKEKFIDTPARKKPVKEKETIPEIKPVQTEKERKINDVKVKVPERISVEKKEREKVSVDDTITTRLKIRVIKKQRKIPISARFKINLKDSPDPGKKPLRSVTRRSSRFGWLFIAPKEDVNWIEIKVAQRGYRAASKLVRVQRGKDTRVLVELTPVPPRKKAKKPVVVKGREKNNGEFIFKPVYFSSNSSQIKLEYYPVIHNLINYMRRNRKIKLEIIGHSDKFGPLERNRRISYLRAKTVRDYMIKFGLKRGRFSIKGVGSHHPAVYTGKTRYSDFNRRVEFRIISEGEPKGYSR
jgi:outer membrane protein OmpA-like peptidoglycan-associated protein